MNEHYPVVCHEFIYFNGQFDTDNIIFGAMLLRINFDRVLDILDYTTSENAIMHDWWNADQSEWNNVKRENKSTWVTLGPLVPYSEYKTGILVLTDPTMKKTKTEACIVE